MEKPNAEIREIAKSSGVKLWQVAEEIGMSDAAFSRKLRHELADKDRERVLNAIRRLATGNAGVVLAADILTIRETVNRAKAEGLPVSEYTLRNWIKAGRIPVTHAGTKALVYYPNVVRFIHAANGGE